MSNDSASGGALAPAALPVPLEGQDLNRFFQQWMAGIIGVLDGTMVRPEFQTEPPNIPTSGTAWMAFRYTKRKSDTFAYVSHTSVGGVQQDNLQRHEEISILCSFYDTGTNGQADLCASLLRDGLSIPQNIEALTQNNMGFVACEEMIPLPALLNQLWLYRVDLTIVIRREVFRAYPVLDVLSAQGTIYTDTGLPPVPIKVP